MSTPNPQTTAVQLASTPTRMPHGTLCTVAQILSELRPDTWLTIDLSVRQQIGIEFRKAIERGVQPPESSWRRVGKNERGQTVYEVIRRSKAGLSGRDAVVGQQ
ncbi:hypothetical protein [Cupriavidus nantongensis]|uniref:Uncharacterized protein n=1 Tax=Cupriavidus nantongensis TaxID=1796606 RepID=A0A142JHV6_9BURK|nr:hypothetical protein [Cupriavidus nantongensis]AMR77668.1 hypothetical protein A2G96_07930 [Cupriavidus nantongensis]